MTRTVGDTSKTHAAARFIAVDDAGPADGGPANAALMVRLIRNSNWLEARTRRMLVCEMFTIDDEPVNANRVADPLGTLATGQMRTQASHPTVFGPWVICASKREITCQVGVAVSAGNIARVAFELMSERNEPGWTPTTWTTLDNSGGGAPAWFDAAVQVKTAAPGLVDWLRLWIVSDDDGLASLSAQGSGATGLVAGFGVYDPAASYGGFAVLDAAGANPTDYRLPDFQPAFRKRLVVYAGAAGASDVIAGPLILYDALGDADSDGFLDTVYWDGSLAGAFTYGNLVGKEYELRESGEVGLRYVLAYEAVTGVTDADPTRPDFQPMDDELGHTGNRHMRSLLNKLEANADLHALRTPEVMVNQSFAEPQRADTKWRQKFVSGTAFTTICEHGLKLEQELPWLLAQFTYYCSATSFGPYALQCRVRLLNSTGGVLETGPTSDFVPQVGSTSFAVLPFASFWPGPWWGPHPAQLSPLMSLDVSAREGGFGALQLQVRTDSTGNSIPASEQVVLDFISMHAWHRTER